MQPLVIVASQGLRRIKEAYTPIGGVINIRINNAFIVGGDDLILFDAEGLVNITLDNDGLMVFGFMEPIKDKPFVIISGGGLGLVRIRPRRLIITGRLIVDAILNTDEGFYDVGVLKPNEPGAKPIVRIAKRALGMAKAL
ncbi:hypothetical protein [Vulcanisaeta sp. EB80]|uniref:hypothetical protein n=1 Tax=Vulcanisaeta sp. EB80 TaxID=1650660 RepID=UPI00117BEAAE|nr:hypothetical protein [Vulcanisaeta sp. EB80]